MKKTYVEIQIENERLKKALMDIVDASCKLEIPTPKNAAKLGALCPSLGPFIEKTGLAIASVADLLE